MANILLIDDDTSIQILFSQLIEHMGHQVTVAQDGREGMKCLEDNPTDLVITDIMMPEMDGLELIPRIRNHATSPKLPVIAISGGMRGTMVNFLPLAKHLGACRALEKPIALEDLRAAIEELLQKPLSGEADCRPTTT